MVALDAGSSRNGFRFHRLLDCKALEGDDGQGADHHSGNDGDDEHRQVADGEEDEEAAMGEPAR